jgi:hypothetical protein
MRKRLNVFAQSEKLMTKRSGIKRSRAITTRLLRVACLQCGYTVRVTRKWLAIGSPLCPKHRTHMV